MSALKCLALVAVLVACVAAQANQGYLTTQGFLPTDWNRVWTDSEFGGFLYTCVKGRTLSGTYSDVGIVNGVISADGRTVNGTFYEAGFTDFNSGSFVWKMSTSKQTFRGKYWFDGQPCIKKDWNEDEVLDIAQTAQCFTANNETGGNAVGVWDDGLGNTLSVCLTSDGFVEASITGTLGNVYIRGETAPGRVTLQTSSVREGNATNYISLFQATGTNTLDEFFYFTSENNLVSFESVLHGRRRWTRVTTATANTCSANRRLVVNPWAGAFTDMDFGQGRLYLCQAGNQVWGVYSELGFISGTTSVNGLTLTGVFYDGGDSNKVSGPFSLTLAPNFDSFTGSWYFYRTPDEVISWSETRTSALTPTSRQCLTPYVPTFGLPTVSGRWSTVNISQYFNPLTGSYRLPRQFNSYLDVCFNPLGTFTASYFVQSTNTRGYMTGNFIDNGRSLQMQWYEDRRQGIEIQRLTAPGLMQGYRWDWPDIQLADFFYCDDDETTIDNWWFFHKEPQYYQISQSTTPLLCDRNADLLRYAVPSSDFDALFPTPAAPVAPAQATAVPTAVVRVNGNNVVIQQFSPAGPVSPAAPVSPVAPASPVANNNVFNADTPDPPATPLIDFFPSPSKNNKDDNNAAGTLFPSVALALLFSFALTLVFV